MSIKRTVIPLMVLLVLVAATGCFNKTAQQDTAAPAGIGVIDLNKAVEVHPKYQQLLTLKKELNTIVAQAEVEQQQAAAKAKPQAGGLLPPDGAALNTALEQEFKEKMAAKQAELQQTLAAKAGDLHSKLETELKEYSSEVDQEYQPQIFNLQLKLKTVQLSQEELTALQAEVQKLQQIRSEKLAIKEKELSERMNASLAPEQAAAEQQLAAYAKELQAELAQKAAAASAEIAARNQASLDSLAPDPGAVTGQLAQQAGMKRQEIQVLEEFILQDVRDKAAKIAAERQLDSVIANVQVNVSAMDITEAVIAEFKK
ncbi:molecular chaperone Skp|uniref:Periplasmic chaperone for outer membrane proteins Skp n=1 Tax=Dendrosporobacter quercicolus TaxID=146817 RepID=A0A1G9R4E0_9FIRM|nr:molecular chaperone Skp [Dendrosporobacter quercicolus]NSL48478.1 molecular chaperone Skp [Dendrosporobacter quercicolus DSM 1736]SDM18166.1 periplasmic chaperone for outer membrane proteins Skp [Dendrosporobacter quercicolus]